MSSEAWDEVRAAIAAAPYPVEVLPPDPVRAEQCLALLGITTRSWLGTVTMHTGGLMVDHGWVRVLGSGNGGLPDVGSVADPAAGGLIVGHDVLGGQFAWLPDRPGVAPTVHYFDPSTLTWADTELGYRDWLTAILGGLLTEFYESVRWPGWEAEVSEVGRDQGIHTWPPMWSVEGSDLSAVSRKPVAMTELVLFYDEVARQLGTSGAL